MIKVKIKHTKSNDGRLWIKTLDSFQCAACLYLQPSHRFKRKNGIVVSYIIKGEDEQHAPDCKQK